MNWSTCSLALCLVAAGAGPCSEPADRGAPSGPEAAAEAAPARPKRQTPTTQAFMRAHAAAADGVRAAAIAGELEALRRGAAVIAADDWSANLREDYRPHMAALQAAARAAAQATSLRDAAAAIGELGAACASCHQQASGPAPGAAMAPPPIEDAMAAHAAAEALLWDGLTLPSEARWAAGAHGLLEAPSLDSDVADVSELAHRTSALARQALDGKQPDAALYGSLLSTCAGCHARVGLTPRPR